MVPSACVFAASLLQSHTSGATCRPDLGFVDYWSGKMATGLVEWQQSQKYDPTAWPSKARSIYPLHGPLEQPLCTISPSLRHPQHTYHRAHLLWIQACIRPVMLYAQQGAGAAVACPHLQAHSHRTSRHQSDKCILCVWSPVTWERCFRYFRCWSHSKQC